MTNEQLQNMLIRMLAWPVVLALKAPKGLWRFAALIGILPICVASLFIIGIPVGLVLIGAVLWEIAHND